MSRRRNPAKRPQARTLVVVCTGGGTHPRRVLNRIEVRRGGQRFDGVSLNDEGRYEGNRRVVEAQTYAVNESDFLKGVRIKECPDGCAYDLVLKDETIYSAFPKREDVTTYEVDVSGGANLS